MRSKQFQHSYVVWCVAKDLSQFERMSSSTADVAEKSSTSRSTSSLVTMPPSSPAIVLSSNGGGVGAGGGGSTGVVAPSGARRKKRIAVAPEAQKIRVYAHKKSEPSKNRVLAIDTSMSWDELLQLLSQKFQFQATYVALEVGSQNVEIDDVGALHNDDWLVVDGISIDDDNDANGVTSAKNGGRSTHSTVTSSSLVTASTSDARVNEIAPALLSLTNSLARLTHKLEAYTERLDAAQQRTLQQHEQLMKLLPARVNRDPRSARPTAAKQAVPPIDPTYERLRVVAMFEEHTAPVWCLTVSGTTLISGSEDATIRTWSLETFKHVATMTGHDSTVHCLCVFSKRWLISGSDDKSVRVWDLNKLKCVNVAPDSHTQPIISIAVNAYSLFTGSLHEIQVFDMKGQAFRENGWKPVRTLSGHKGHWVHGLLLHGEYLISSSNNLIKVWNATTLEELRTVKTVQGGSIYALAVVEKDGKPLRLVTGTWESTIQIFEFSTLEAIKTVPAHQASVLSLVVSGRYLYSGSYDTSVKVWDATTDTMLRPIDTLYHTGGKVEALVAAEGYLCSAGTDSRIRVWGTSKLPAVDKQLPPNDVDNITPRATSSSK